MANELLTKAFHFIPGQILRFNSAKAEEGNDTIFEKVDEFTTDSETEWEIQTNVYNISYFHCRKTDSYAYFTNDELMFQFTGFKGDKDSLLYYFYLAFYKVQKGFYEKLSIKDKVPQNNLFSRKRMFLQDFIAPFYFFLKGEYKMNYLSVDDDFSPSEIKLETTAVHFMKFPVFK